MHSQCTLIAFQKQYQNYRKTRDSQPGKREKMTQFFYLRQNKVYNNAQWTHVLREAAVCSILDAIDRYSESQS